MGQALGWLGWEPDAFWASSLYELTAALDGYLEARGQRKPGLSEDVLDDLIAMVEAEEAREREEQQAEQPASAATAADLKRIFG